MNHTRIGIVGLGNIGQIHVNNLLEGKVKRGVLTAVADAFPDKLPEYEAKGIKTYESGEALIDSGEIDTIIIATPHFQHTTLGIAARKAGHGHDNTVAAITFADDVVRGVAIGLVSTQRRVQQLIKTVKTHRMAKQRGKGKSGIHHTILIPISPADPAGVRWKTV